MINENKIKTQKVMDYIIYMITASYFKKAICVSHMLEDRLFLFYKETRNDMQYRLEEKCVRYVENKMFKELSPNIWKEEVKVKLVSDAYGMRTAVFIKGDDWMLRMTSNCLEEKGIVMDYKFTTIKK